MRRTPVATIVQTVVAVFLICLAFSTFSTTADAQQIDLADEFGGPEFGSLATSNSAIPAPPPWGFKVDAGWYCDTFDGYFDSDRELQDINGRERFGMVFLGAHWRATELGSDDRPIPIIVRSRVTYAMYKYTDDDNEFEDSESGLQTLLFGGRTRVPINDTFSASASIDFVLDIADEDKNLTDEAHALVFNVGARKKFGDASLGLDLYRTERLDDRYVETNALRVRGTYNLFGNDKVDVRGGLSLLYHSDTDEGGNVLSAGVDARVNFKNSPLALKLGGGCTEDYVPTGNYAFAGENYWQNKSLSLSGYYKF